MHSENDILLKISNASENNLKGISVSLPHNKIIVVTGVSGSGKSSLAFDVVYAESRCRFISNLSGQSRHLFSKLNRPDVESIEGLRPAIAVDQKTLSSGPRSTVGTLSEIYDNLRLLFARLGKSDIPGLEINRSLFSFNTAKGACPECKGLGLTDFIDPELLISDKNKSLREGALNITTPTGYIIYSQVTMAVLNQVCNAEGFNVDIPWKDLTEEQKRIVLYGTEKIKIPFGKHPLESRMKWKGITAKPREEGYYRGILPIMEEILMRDRNDNILRFARTAECPFCNGTRLSKEAVSVKWAGMNIAEMSSFTISETDDFFRNYVPGAYEKAVFDEISAAVLKRTELLKKLELDYLSISRSSSSLSAGEAQRLRLVNQAVSSLQGLIYVLDEPTAGLHPSDCMKLMQVLADLCDKGNTVIVVEHDENIIRNADWIVDIGPNAGFKGGELLFSGTFGEYLNNTIPASPTWKMLTENEENKNSNFSVKGDTVRFSGLCRNNVKNAELAIVTKTLNVITGVSGAGKSSLAEAIEEKVLSEKTKYPFGKVVYIDQKAIGRTPRSNPATYTKVFDSVRKLYGGLSESVKSGLKNSDFSFNTGNGRCPQCDGAGYMQVGMHFMGHVEIICDVCHGQRFLPAVLNVTFKGKSVLDILNMRISDACEFFRCLPNIYKPIEIMDSLGLGYLFLGQSSSSLSGGEAQRIKLAAELTAPSGKNCLYLFDEPTTGLHNADVALLLNAFEKLTEKGHTILCIEHHSEIIKNAGNIIDMGPGSGKDGGRVVYCGDKDGLKTTENSVTARYMFRNKIADQIKRSPVDANKIAFKNVNTNNLKGISFEIEHNKITVITGRSGSGKTSLAFDTLYVECNRRFTENWSSYIRSHLPQLPGSDFEYCSGITPALAVRQDTLSDNPRSTAGTYSGIYDLLRLLFSRLAGQNSNGKNIYSSFFSFNHQDGACMHCKGLGEIRSADPEKIITHPHKSVLNGAMDGTKTGKFYGDVNGQYVAAVIAVGKSLNIDFSVPWKDLGEKEKDIIMYGTGETKYKIEWNYSRGAREGVYDFEKNWPGLVYYINEEYERKHADKRGDTMLSLMKTVVCPHCNGSRLNPEALKYKVGGLNIHEFASMEVSECRKWFSRNISNPDIVPFRKTAVAITEKLETLISLSLAYLPINRTTGSLSGGERQRLKLAGILASSFTAVTFILDEPASGLHPADREKIAERILRLKERGNTVVIVEHQKDFFRIADNIIEMGPGAGKEGGEVLYSGSTGEYMKNNLEAQSPDRHPERGVVSKPIDAENHHCPITKWCADFQRLSPFRAGQKVAENYNGNSFETAPGSPCTLALNESVHIKNAYSRNLKNININFPLNTIVSITGVSGSGKTTLLRDVIYNSLTSGKAEGCEEIEVPKTVKVIYCSPASSKKNSSGTVMTYTGISDPLRKIFASTEKAKETGLGQSHFSLHQPGGRCETCKGNGFVSVAMDFLPDVELPCTECGGKRFLPEVLEVKVEGKTINDFMNLTLSEINAMEINSKEGRAINLITSGLIKTGLGHLVMGQRINDISGGEWQRLQMAQSLQIRNNQPALFLFDEPGGGLSDYDIAVMADLFNELVAAGHTVIFTEHRPELIRYSTWNIDLGPDGGSGGGNLLYCGKTSDLNNCKESLTAKYL